MISILPSLGSSIGAAPALFLEVYGESQKRDVARCAARQPVAGELHKGSKVPRGYSRYTHKVSVLRPIVHLS